MWPIAKDQQEQIVLWEYRRPKSFGKWRELPQHCSKFLESKFRDTRRLQEASLSRSTGPPPKKGKKLAKKCTTASHPPPQHSNTSSSSSSSSSTSTSSSTCKTTSSSPLPSSSTCTTQFDPVFGQSSASITTTKNGGVGCGCQQQTTTQQTHAQNMNSQMNGISVSIPVELVSLKKCPLQVFFDFKGEHCMFSPCCGIRIPIRRTTCQWSWETPCPGQAGKLVPGPWHPFSQEEMLFLEESLRSGQSTVEIPNSRYEFNLQRRIMTDKQTQQRCRMRRLCQTSNDARHSISQPDFEDTIQPKRFHISEPSHEEIDAVAQHFNGDPNMYGYELCVVHKVHNYHLFQAFDKQKTEMGKAHNQTMLFHGCPPQVIPYICQEGFDFRLYGKNAAVYGNGAYFAKYPSYSHKFSDVGRSKQSEIWRLLVAQVLIGRYAQGCKGMARPPRIHAGGKFYDSLVDSVSDPHVFVTFERCRAYPDFVMTYRKTNVPQHITTKLEKQAQDEKSAPTITLPTTSQTSQKSSIPICTPPLTISVPHTICPPVHTPATPPLPTPPTTTCAPPQPLVQTRPPRIPPVNPTLQSGLGVCPQVSSPSNCIRVQKCSPVQAQQQQTTNLWKPSVVQLRCDLKMSKTPKKRSLANVRGAHDASSSRHSPTPNHLRSASHRSHSLPRTSTSSNRVFTFSPSDTSANNQCALNRSQISRSTSCPTQSTHQFAQQQTPTPPPYFNQNPRAQSLPTCAQPTQSYTNPGPSPKRNPTLLSQVVSTKRQRLNQQTLPSRPLPPAGLQMLRAPSETSMDTSICYNQNTSTVLSPIAGTPPTPVTPVTPVVNTPGVTSPVVNGGVLGPLPLMHRQVANTIAYHQTSQCLGSPSNELASQLSQVNLSPHAHAGAGVRASAAFTFNDVAVNAARNPSDATLQHSTTPNPAIPRIQNSVPGPTMLAVSSVVPSSVTSTIVR